MKIICKQEKLIKALSLASRAVSTTATHEITKGILIKTEGDMQVSLSTTDFQISITTKMDAIVNEHGGVVVTARLFTDLVRKLPAGDILIAVDEKKLVSIKTEWSEYKLQGKDEEEFPLFDKDEEGKRLKVGKEVLRDLIDGTAFAASSDETRGVFSGVLFELKDEILSFVATDYYRVAIKRERGEEYKGEEIRVVVPAKLIREVSKILADTSGEEEALLDIDEKRMKVFMENTQVRMNLLEGEYFKYNESLPKENKTRAILARSELLDAVERAAMLKSDGKNACVRCSISEGNIVISARAIEGQGREIVAAEKTGEDLEIGFDARFLTDALKAVSDDMIEMQYNTSVSPCLIKPTEGNRFEYLVLPVRLSTVNV